MADFLEDECTYDDMMLIKTMDTKAVMMDLMMNKTKTNNVYNTYHLTI